MLTPIEIQGIVFKNGRGYAKKDVDSFMEALYHDYEQMYKENLELKDKVNTLSDGIQYYKNLEKTLQKALVLAEKTSEETKDAAQKQAEVIERQAKLNADMMLVDARHELEMIESQIMQLMQQFEQYKAQFKQIATAQIDMLDTEAFNLRVKQRDIPYYSMPEKEEERKEEDITPNVEEVLEKVDETTLKSVSQEAKQEEELAKEVSVVADDIATSVAAALEETTEKKEEKPAQQEEFNTQDDLEIKMLQKLLNEIKMKSDGEQQKNSEELPEIDFEFIKND